MSSENFVFSLFSYEFRLPLFAITAIFFAGFSFILGIFYSQKGIIFNILNNLYNAIREISIKNTGSAKYTKLLFFFFWVIAFSNTMRCFGFFPINSKAFMPIIYALVIFAVSLFGGFKVHGYKFLWNLVPKEVPVFMKPVLMIIESIVLLTKPISLCARLFLNIYIGHLVIHALYDIAGSFGNLSYLALPLFVLINVLEIGIGILQAYIFTIFGSLLINTCTSKH